MLVSRAFVFIPLCLVGLCLARAIELDSTPERREVSFLSCAKIRHGDKMHIQLLKDLELAISSPSGEVPHILDPRDIMSGESFWPANPLQDRALPQIPAYVGLTGEKDEQGRPILGRVSYDQADQFRFYECDYSAFMDYQPSEGLGERHLYGHIALEKSGEEASQCVGISQPGSRNQPLVLTKCFSGDDSNQFSVFWRYTKSTQIKEDSTLDTIRYFEFLGMPSERKREAENIGQYFAGHYSTLFDHKTSTIVIDYRQKNEKSGLGQPSALTFSMERKGR